MGEDAARAAFASQAMWCERLGSPFTARLVKLLGERLDRSTAAGRRVLAWPGDPAPEADGLPLRLAGALHALVRRGDAPGLAALYPPAPLPDEASLWREIAPHLDSEPLLRFLDQPPQTNEVGRAAPFMAGLLAVAELYPLPLHLFELGASAGLNLLLDRYAHDLGGLRAGDLTSRLQLKPAWKGPPPPQAEVRVLSRAGADLNPLRLPESGERLLAYVWTDQHARLARVEAALAIAAADPPPVEQGDAADWLDRTLPAAPREGAVRVVFHSIAWQYFPAATRHRIEALVARLGGEASSQAPLAWLRYEQRPGDPKHSLRLRTWPGENRLLAWLHPHGADVEWVLRDGPSPTGPHESSTFVGTLLSPSSG
jgi:hypothetical protein